MPVSHRRGHIGLKNACRRIVIHPFASDPSKRWPWRCFEELSRRLLSDPNLSLVFIGEPMDAEITAFVGHEKSDRIEDLRGKTTLTELAALLGEVDGLISL